MNPKGPKNPKGFTLVELLIVMVVVVILASLLLPAFLNAKDKTVKAKCANNIRQIWTALSLYANSNEQQYPDIGGTWWPNFEPLWSRRIYPNYLDDEKIFDCPATTAIGNQWSPDYTYTPPTSGMLSTSTVLEDTHHISGEITLYRSGTVKVQ